VVAFDATFWWISALKGAVWSSDWGRTIIGTSVLTRIVRLRSVWKHSTRNLYFLSIAIFCDDICCCVVYI